jgi:hypothetical protein
MLKDGLDVARITLHRQVTEEPSVLKIVARRTVEGDELKLLTESLEERLGDDAFDIKA